MSELRDIIWVEKYRPDSFDDIILENKSHIMQFLEKNETIPSFLFCSQKPGTGKTTLARLIIKKTNSDSLIINSSDERGIDTIREKVKRFASALSTNNQKRCVFLDEADGMTRQSQDSLRNLMETLSDNCFFIFTANDAGKIIEAIRSRCIEINFENPDINAITSRLTEICDKESVKVNKERLDKLIKYNYPDMRSMINTLQLWKTTGNIIFDEDEFIEFWQKIKDKDITYVYQKVYSGTFKILDFNRWLFERLYNHWEKLGLEKTSKIAECLADNEKYWNLGANLQIVFLNNVTKIMNIL